MSVVVTTPERAGSSTGNDRARRLAFLDGLRGLAALYVLLHHAYMVLVVPHTTAVANSLLCRLLKPFYFGHYAVSVFIVLSGYCLMLPVAHTRDWKIKGGFGAYLLRRSRRILPAYFAALVASLLLIAMAPVLRVPNGGVWDEALPAFTPGVLISHLTLFHNLNVHWSTNIDPSMWSVATEWQIYFIFALLLLPVGRRFGYGGALATATLLAMTIHIGARGNFDTMAPWYIVCFTLGMGGALMNSVHNPQSVLAALTRKPVLLTRLAFSVLGSVIAWQLLKPDWCWSHIWFMDILVGVGTTGLIVSYARLLQVPEAKEPGFLKILQSPQAMFLGAISYSLYLIHFPLLVWIDGALRHAISPTLHVVLIFLGGCPLCIVAGYLFHLAFEKPFMVSGVRSIPAPGRKRPQNAVPAPETER